jgi:cytochrome c oxidase subunit II
MKSHNFVLWIINATLLVALLVSTSVALLAKPRDAVKRIVAIKVKCFESSPDHVTRNKGVPVILQVSSLDVPRGFNLPDLNVRADVIPEKSTQVRILLQQTGRLVLHGDIFCSVSHEDSEGVVENRQLIVT